MKTLKRRLSAAVALACLVGAAMPAYADTTDDLLLTLKQKGILTDAEYQQLVARKAAQATPAPAADNQQASQGGQQAPQSAPQSSDNERFVRVADKGVGLDIGGVNVAFSGSVNGFYVHNSGGADNVDGGLASGGKTSAIRNGLLPGYFKIDVTTQQAGWNIGAHFGMYPGIDSSVGVGGANAGGNPSALATAGIDFRQVYLTFGKPNIGEFKIGRDIGLFGSDAILNDMTLLSIGSTGSNAAPSNTSLGRIGIGYIYTDFQPQITYTSPNFSGFQVSAGVFQPLNTSGQTEENKAPGFQGKLTYDTKGKGWTLHAWLSGISQRHNDVITYYGDTTSYTGNAFDVGAKLGVGGLSLVGYYYDGKGVGTTGLFIDSIDDAGQRRKSNGFYGQATYTLGKFMLGGSYGESHLSYAPGETSLLDSTGALIYDPQLLTKNSSWVGQGRYQLTPWVTLIGEYVWTKAKAHDGDEATSNTIATGAILSF